MAVEMVSGDQRIVDLGNAISDAVYDGLASGLAPDVVCSILVGVAADYWLQTYERPVTALAEILTEKAKAHAR